MTSFQRFDLHEASYPLGQCFKKQKLQNAGAPLSDARAAQNLTQPNRAQQHHAPVQNFPYRTSPPLKAALPAGTCFFNADMRSILMVVPHMQYTRFAR